MKIAVVGCGGIAHVQVPFILDDNRHAIVGICDRDRRQAEVLAQNFPVGRVYTNFSQLLQEQRPDVVHVLTPPQAHAAVALEAMEAGSHVFVEKPMALSVEEADIMIAAAESHGVKLCVDHTQLFDPVILKTQRLLAQGVIGKVIAVESYYGFNRAQAPERHWEDGLLGGAFHDVAPHPLALVLQFLEDPLELRTATVVTGSLGPGMPDELRVLMTAKDTLGMLAISFGIKPYVNFLKIYGSKAILNADLANMILSIERLRPLPKAAARGLMTIEQALQLATGAIGTVFNFVLGRIKPYQGMGNLINAFYDSIEHGRAAPVTGEAGRRVLEVFSRIRMELPVPSPQVFTAPHKTRPPKVLVTGATGFLGSHLVEHLIEHGEAVRSLVRSTSRLSHLKRLGVECVDGALSDGENLKRAMEGCDIVFHCAAATAGSWNNYAESTIRGTEGILAASEAVAVKRLVYISSLSVYAVSQFKDHEWVTEDAPLDPRPAERGFYTQSKVEAEKLVLNYAQEKRVPISILRPGIIYGPRGNVFSPSVGFKFKNRVFMTIGPGDHLLPLVYVRNVVDAIWLSATREEAVGGIYNIVDDEEITQQEYINEFIKRTGVKGFTLHMPFGFIYVAASMLEVQAALTKKTPFLTRYRLVCGTKDIRYDTSRAKQQLQWIPNVSLQEGLARTFESYKNYRH